MQASNQKVLSHQNKARKPFGLAKEIWQKFKDLAKNPKPLEYARDKNGKEIKFGLKAPNHRISLHDGSKPGYQHKPGKAFRQSKNLLPSQHTRVVIGRARKMKISVREYYARFCS